MSEDKMPVGNQNLLRATYDVEEVQLREENSYIVNKQNLVERMEGSNIRYLNIW